MSVGTVSEYMNHLLGETKAAKERLEKERQVALTSAIRLLTDEIKRQAVEYAQEHGENSFERKINENLKYGKYTIDNKLLQEVQGILRSQYLFTFEFRKQYDYWLVNVGWPTVYKY